MDKNTTHYEYIIIGAGAAGFMLADAMGSDAYFRNASILIIEKDVKQSNDRTWCYWERGNGPFDPLVHKSWDSIYFAGKVLHANLDIAPYSYKMLRGIDFYNAYLQKIGKYSNIRIVHDTVTKVLDNGTKALVTTSGGTYSAANVFNSMFDFKSLLKQDRYPVLQQHFIGWFIKTKTAVFNDGQATFMDFSIPQNGNTRFMYVLPFTANEALVEYTLFSETLLKQVEYEMAIKAYLKEKYNTDDFQILEKERGSIPMSCYNFEHNNSANILHIGTAGGWSKPSTGFTFINTSRNIGRLVDHLKRKKKLTSFTTKNRFWYYDLLLLDILHNDNSKGRQIFESLFKKRSPQLILKFLEEKTSIWEDIKIISACPKSPFVKALFRRLLW